jgi:hypothetical protein
MTVRHYRVECRRYLTPALTERAAEQLCAEMNGPGTACAEQHTVRPVQPGDRPGSTFWDAEIEIDDGAEDDHEGGAAS